MSDPRPTKSGIAAFFQENAPLAAGLVTIGLVWATLGGRVGTLEDKTRELGVEYKDIQANFHKLDKSLTELFVIIENRLPPPK